MRERREFVSVASVEKLRLRETICLSEREAAVYNEHNFKNRNCQTVHL